MSGISRRTVLRGRRGHGAAVAGIAGVRRPGATGARSRSGSRVLFMGNGINANHWWAKGTGAEMELGKSLGAARAAQDEDQRHHRPVQQAGDRRRHSSRADRQHALRRAASEGARSQGAASAWTRCSPTSSARRRRSRAWCWAASSRSPATTRRTSRWPTARTSPGRAPTRRCRWRSIRRWPSTACSTTAAAGATRASSTASRTRRRA